MKKITFRDDFQPPKGREFVASSYPEPGAYLIDFAGMRQVVFVYADGIVQYFAASLFMFDGEPAPPIAGELVQVETARFVVSEDFVLRLVATALAPASRAQERQP